MSCIYRILVNLFCPVYFHKRKGANCHYCFKSVLIVEKFFCGDNETRYENWPVEICEKTRWFAIIIQSCAGLICQKNNKRTLITITLEILNTYVFQWEFSDEDDILRFDPIKDLFESFQCSLFYWRWPALVVEIRF